ncbi:MAG: 3'(2'),5'-bisphosphate nucleotidase CysQ [Sandaracinaceae bacterium]
MLDRELVEAVKLAREAGQILLRIYATDFDVQEKRGEGDRKDPVTEADRLANDLLVRRLREAFPNDGVVAEETEDKSDARRRGRCWYVDPLDGTKEFIAKNGEFSVMIGLAIDGEARLGVVYKPVGDRLYRGVIGDSAFVDVGDRTFALKVSDVTKPADLRLVVSRSHRDPLIGELVDTLGIKDERLSGSVGLKIGLIAEREADLYVHLSHHSSAWDACAPEAVLRAAGGRFVDLSGSAFEYGGEDMANRRGILAANRQETLDAVLPAVIAVARKKGLVPNADTAEPADDGAPTEERSIEPASDELTPREALSLDSPPGARTTKRLRRKDFDGEE